MIGDALDLLVEGVIIHMHKYNGNPIGLQLPAQVELAVTYTEPGVRGDTASGSVTKPAKLETGIEIRVPLFIKEGEKIKVIRRPGNSQGGPEATQLSIDISGLENARRARRRRSVFIAEAKR